MADPMATTAWNPPQPGTDEWHAYQFGRATVILELALADTINRDGSHRQQIAEFCAEHGIGNTHNAAVTLTEIQAWAEAPPTHRTKA